MALKAIVAAAAAAAIVVGLVLPGPTVRPEPRSQISLLEIGRH